MVSLNWSLPVPVHLQPKQRGILGAFLLGIFFGIVSSPCATPVLALILTFVASKGEVAYGTSLLFVYALGHCALIFLAGTATGFAESFIKSKGISNMTTWGKRVGGVIVVFAGIYLVLSGNDTLRFQRGETYEKMDDHLLLSLLFSSPMPLLEAQQSSSIQMYLFYADDCPSCQAILQSYVPTLKSMYPFLEIKTFDLSESGLL